MDVDESGRDVDESGRDGCVGVSPALALGEDDPLADPDADPDADMDADPDADMDAAPDPDVAVPEGRLDGSGGGTLGDGLAGTLRLGVGSGTDGTGTAGWVVEGGGEAEWAGAGDDVAGDAVPVGGAVRRPDAVPVREGLLRGAAGLVAGVPGSPPPDGAVLAPAGPEAGTGRPAVSSGGREPDRLADRVGAEAGRPTPPTGAAWPAVLAGTTGRIPETSRVVPVASAASVLTATSAIAAPGRAFV